MDNEIREIVERLKIKEYKEGYLNNQERLFKLERLMSTMTFDREVGLYAFYMDEINYLIKELVDSEPSIREKICEKINALEIKANELGKKSKVQDYIMLRKQYFNISFNNKYYDNYFKLINITLREELSKLKKNDIYIAQSKYDYDKNIIDLSSLTFDKLEKGTILIEPVYDMESFRDFRHFYNKTSFKYLEGLTEDYSFDLEGKNLGKVKIRKL